MNWSTKLKSLIEGVLNEYTSPHQYEYEVTVFGEHDVEILHQEEEIMKHWNKRELSSCWKEVGQELIHKIIDRRIIEHMKEI